MAQVRGHWLAALKSGLEEMGARASVERAVSATCRNALATSSTLAWYDEANVVEVYAALHALRDLDSVRNLGRISARLAMQTVWRPLVGPIVRMYVGRPAPAFAQMPTLWDAVRRDGGLFSCTTQEARAVVTELRGCVHVAEPAWREAWLGHHEALLRELRVGGRCTLDHLDERTKTLRVRTAWAFALTGAPTEGSLART